MPEVEISPWSLELWDGNTPEHLRSLMVKHQDFIDSHPGDDRILRREQWISEIRAELASRNQTA